MIYEYPSVKEARVTEDTKRCSELGKKGNEAKKRRKAFRLEEQIREAHQRMRDANELICPID